MERRMKKNLHLAPVKKMHIRWWSNPQKKSRWYKLYKDLGKIVVCPEDLPWIYMLFATFFSWSYINTGTLNLGIREQPTQYQRTKLYVKQTNVKIGELWIIFPFTFTVWRASEYLPKLIFWIFLECFKWTYPLQRELRIEHLYRYYYDMDHHEQWRIPIFPFCLHGAFDVAFEEFAGRMLLSASMERTDACPAAKSMRSNQHVWVKMLWS